MDRNKAAGKLKQSAKDWLNHDPTDDTFQHDYDQLIKLAKLLKRNKLDEARKFMYSLDTIVRDQVPDSIYYWLAEED